MIDKAVVGDVLNNVEGDTGELIPAGAVEDEGEVECQSSSSRSLPLHYACLYSSRGGLLIIGRYNVRTDPVKPKMAPQSAKID